MANWTPASWVGQQFGVQAAYRPPPAGVPSAFRWGTSEGLAELLPGVGLEITEQYVDLVHHSTAALWDLFKNWFGPVATVLGGLEPEQAAAFEADWIAAGDRLNIATDGTCEIPSRYLQVIATKR